MNDASSAQEAALKTYLRAVETASRGGNATEHTYRPALKKLIEELAGSGVRAINEPKHIDCGAVAHFGTAN